MMDSSQVLCHFFVPGNPEPAGSKQSFVPLNKKLAGVWRKVQDPERNDEEVLEVEWPRGMPYKDKDHGRVVVNTVDANKRSPIWKKIVATYGQLAFKGELINGPLSVDFVFCVARPKKHYGTGRNANVLRADAPTFVESRPDALKYCRGAEDALTGIIWTDDSRIVAERIAKIYQLPIGLHVTVREPSELDLNWIRNGQ